MYIHIYAYMRSCVCVCIQKEREIIFSVYSLFRAHSVKKSVFLNVIPRMRYFHESRNRKKMSLFTLERLQ